MRRGWKSKLLVPSILVWLGVKSSGGVQAVTIVTLVLLEMSIINRACSRPSELSSPQAAAAAIWPDWRICTALDCTVSRETKVCQPTCAWSAALQRQRTSKQAAG